MCIKGIWKFKDHYSYKCTARLEGSTLERIYSTQFYCVKLYFNLNLKKTLQGLANWKEQEGKMRQMRIYWESNKWATEWVLFVCLFLKISASHRFQNGVCQKSSSQAAFHTGSRSPTMACVNGVSQHTVPSHMASSSTVFSCPHPRCTSDFSALNPAQLSRPSLTVWLCYFSQ